MIWFLRMNDCHRSLLSPRSSKKPKRNRTPAQPINPILISYILKQQQFPLIIFLDFDSVMLCYICIRDDDQFHCLLYCYHIVLARAVAWPAVRLSFSFCSRSGVLCYVVCFFISFIQSFLCPLHFVVRIAVVSVWISAETAIFLKWNRNRVGTKS